MDEAQGGERRVRIAAPVPVAARALAALAVAFAAAGCKGEPAAAPIAPAPAPVAAPWRPSDIPRIDTHTHLAPEVIAIAVQLAAAHGIVHQVNLSGGSPGRGLTEQLIAAGSTGGRISVFANADFREARRPGYGARMAAALVESKKMGAIGLKVPKGLGLGYEGPDGKLLAVDDHGLDPLFEKAGELHMPVAIHIGDPKAFWRPIEPQNERWDELKVHPKWGYFGAPVPSWQALYDGFEHLVARHPKTIFIGVHFGNDPEDPDRVAQMLDAHPNLYIDTAARVPEIGRHDPAHAVGKMRAFYEKYQDRILFGTDVAVMGPTSVDWMFGSTGDHPPTREEMERFYAQTWRYFETQERGMIHPTPIQGNWSIDGVGLSRPILEKVYHANAERLLGIKLPPR